MGFTKAGGHTNNENHCTACILLESSHGPSNLKKMLPFQVVGEITMLVTTRSASIWISAGFTTGTQL